MWAPTQAVARIALYRFVMSNSGAEVPGGAVQSVDRALSILGFLASDGELGITELAARLGVHKSTAFRLVATLEAHDLVEQNAERGKYRLGVGVVRLAGATALRLDLVQESRPVCTKLAAAVEETVNLVVRSGHDAFYLDQVSGPSALQLHYWVGRRIPLHATSNGKVLLAFATDGVQEEVLSEPLPAFTERTITDPVRLAAELETVRHTGIAIAVDELELGLTAIAAPITGSHGAVVASVSASGPTFRLPAERLPEVAEEVRAAAAEISRRLGWHGIQHDRAV
jgi:DNA-binding IclR family transcriptional regulator